MTTVRNVSATRSNGAAIESSVGVLTHDEPTARVSRRARSVLGLRWVAIAVFSTFSLLSFLDRQLLAAVAPNLKVEFGLSNADYGAVVSAFSIAYMLMTPLAGWFVDRVGLNAGAMVAMAFWSLASAVTGIPAGFGGLLLCRMALGLGEAAGIPSAAKANAVYLQPREMALGTAVQQIGLFGGGIAAPLLVAAIAPQYGWRAAFVLAGALGFIWIPVWWLTSNRIRPVSRATSGRSVAIAAVLRDTRMWSIVFCSLTIMTLYSLWLNWTTIFFVQQLGLTQTDANRYFAWIPPIFATLGGFFGGWMALRRIDAGESAVRARMRACWLVAPAALVTAAVPWSGSPMLAVSGIAISFFVCMTLVTNLHVIPIDLFGPERAAFTSSVLTFAFALMQTVTAPVFGTLIDRFGFGPLCVVLSILPLVGLSIVSPALRREP